MQSNKIGHEQPAPALRAAPGAAATHLLLAGAGHALLSVLSALAFGTLLRIAPQRGTQRDNENFHE